MMLVKCVVYKNGVKHSETSLAELSQFLNKPDHIIWAGFHDATKEELNQIQDIFDLHDVVMEETKEVDQRPRIAEYNNAIYLSAVTHNKDRFKRLWLLALRYSLRHKNTGVIR